MAATKAKSKGTGKSASKGRKKQKVIFIVVDGMADRMDGKTPLQSAKKPNMDWMAANGECGQLSLISKSLWNEIDTKGISQYANVSLLGGNPNKYVLDRGPLEAVGLGIPYNEGNLAVRCNFATVDGDMAMVDRRAGRGIFGLDAITRQINQHVRLDEKYVFMRTYGHRAVFIVQKDLSKDIKGNDVEVGEHIPRIEALNEGAEESARLAQDFVEKARTTIRFYPKNSERIDKGLPSANYIIMRQAGNQLPKLPKFSKKWNVKKPVCISESGVMKATCMLSGFSSINVPEFGSYKKWLDFIFDNVDSALSEYDFVYVHIKPADEAAHDKDPERKREIIEYMDSLLEPYRNFKGVMVITCDHITSSESGEHEYGKVPVLVYGKGKDDVESFDEESVVNGSIGTKSGHSLLSHILGK